MPETLFVDANAWTSEARSKLDKFEKYIDVPNYINYDMLETGKPDIIETGEQIVIQLEAHKDTSFSFVSDQLSQLSLRFHPSIDAEIKKAVKTN